MKACMFCSGLPRFDEYFFENLNNIKSDEVIDLYFFMWQYPIDYGKIFSRIPNQFRIKKFIQIEEPDDEYIIPRDSEDDNIRNVVRACFKQHYGLYRVFRLIDKKYDCYVRFRVDGKVDREIYLESYDLQEHIYTPVNEKYGKDHFESMNDQFAISNYENMKHYCSLYNYLDEYFYHGVTPIHHESTLRFHLNLNRVSVKDGNFNHLLEPKRKFLCR